MSSLYPKCSLLLFSTSSSTFTSTPTSSPPLLACAPTVAVLAVGGRKRRVTVVLELHSMSEDRLRALLANHMNRPWRHHHHDHHFPQSDLKTINLARTIPVLKPKKRISVFDEATTVLLWIRRDKDSGWWVRLL
jgi:hypothetical protein